MSFGPHLDCRRWAGAAGCLVAAAACAPEVARAPLWAAPPSDPSWPMFRHDPSHSALSPRHTPDLLFRFHAGGEIWSSPAIGPDSTLYFGNTDGVVFAVDGHTGQEKWRFQTFAAVWAGPAVAPDGTVFVGTDHDRVLVVAPSGALLRELPVGGPVRGSVVVTARGDVLVPLEDGALYAFDARGRPLWKTAGTSAIDGSPALGADAIYYGAFDRALHAVDLLGHEKWSFPTGGPINSSPAIAADGTVWFGSDDAKVYAVAPGGTLVWSFATQGPVSASPAIGPRGEVAVGSHDGSLYVFR